MSDDDIRNEPAPGPPYFTPRHHVSPGTPIDPAAPVPTLFTPLAVRGARLRNRIIVAPMCQYSCASRGPAEGALTPYHLVHLGHFALKGAALTCIEASAVQRNGRISPQCPGLWSDAQVPGVRDVADFIHGQGGLVALQLHHAGRKASCVAHYVASRHQRSGMRASKEHDGWPDDVVGPSGGEEHIWDGKASSDPSGSYNTPRELSRSDIAQLVQDWASAAKRAVAAGVDVLEIHGAHGYLIHQFLSPVTNRRTDEYGGSFENRTRLVIEIIQAIRASIPATVPLFLRLSATEWLDQTDIGKKYGTWDLASTIELAKIVADLGVDLLDVSSGGNHPQQQLSGLASGGAVAKDYQTKLASQIRRELRAAGKDLLIGAVGLITEADQARDLLETGDADIATEAQVAQQMTEASGGREPVADAILVGRQFLRESEWVLRVAWQLGVDIAWPSQYLRVRFPRL